ncbi:enhancer of translation termination 1-like [Lotus japonicus]|uniref:enhancer of translation termination 1-like n=1 Tax=Lotus japonicus TaxID=34305 RepID=UPI00258AC91A|nr:enhancer of translation termination 1-like [Lotus japonicus]
MGKKKRQKMKELSVAIAESAASKEGGDTKQQESQPQAPRKRGRPRKVVREEGKLVETTMDEAAAASTATQSIMNMEKKEEEEEEEEHEASAKEEEDIQLPKREPSRSRARRKSKPRKST